MKNYQTINESLISREPCTSFEDNTYYTDELFTYFCNNRDYRYVTIFGYYKNTYSWTNEQAIEMYQKTPDGWYDGLGIYRSYDWGKGENQVVTDRHDQDWHIPELDHIVSKDEGARLGWTQEQIDAPENMQVLPRILNRMLSNITNEQAQAIIPLIVAQFPDVVFDKQIKS